MPVLDRLGRRLVGNGKFKVRFGNLDNDITAVLYQSDTPLSVSVRSTDSLEFNVDFE
jgi:hypothetical protein